jgi:hypothetical protein
MNIIYCHECDIDFEITCDTIDDVQFCPFCSSKIRKLSDEDFGEEEDSDWEVDQ